VDVDEEWRSWCGRFDELHGSILDLFHSRRVWRTIRAAVEVRPDAERSGIVEHWLTRCYSTSQMTAIRRQLDKDRRAASLWRCLDLLEKKPGMATRGRFAEQLENRGAGSRVTEFDRFADPGKDYVSRHLVTEDAERLVAAGDIAKTIVNKVVAHHEYRPDVALPEITWGEFDNAIEVVGDLYKKYWGLRHPGGVLSNLVPDLPSGWDRVFVTGDDR
jgi:hypothetical protein